MLWIPRGEAHSNCSENVSSKKKEKEILAENLVSSLGDNGTGLQTLGPDSTRLWGLMGPGLYERRKLICVRTAEQRPGSLGKSVSFELHPAHRPRVDGFLPMHTDTQCTQASCSRVLGGG
jgi:hypothetical protein